MVATYILTLHRCQRSQCFIIYQEPSENSTNMNVKAIIAGLVGRVNEAPEKARTNVPLKMRSDQSTTCSL